MEFPSVIRYSKS